MEDAEAKNRHRNRMREWRKANPERDREASRRSNAKRKIRVPLDAPLPVTESTCTHCKTTKLAAAFTRDPYRLNGLKSWCSQCNTERATAWRKAHPERFAANQRRHALKQQYGITPEQYEEMLADQDGGCAICGKAPGKQRLAVDHCHETGSVRGLLCFGCNTMLGKLNDNQELLHRAVLYLARVERSIKR